jgi:serine/threonine-protein phosphatase 2B catalytic subunit
MKFDQEIYDLLMESFDRLPVAAVINGQFLALHGGISPEFKSILELNRLDRFKEPPQLGALCDVLWADPVDNDSGLQQLDWMPNGSRGCSYYFGWTNQVHCSQFVSQEQRSGDCHPSP